MNTLQLQLSAILDSDKGERGVHAFLKANDNLISMAFNPAWNYFRCISEFRLGGEFRSDFMILSADSVNWHAVFIELKDYGDKLYNKDGTPTRAHRQAQKQLGEWREWTRINEQYLRKRFAAILEKDNALPIWPYDVAHRKGYVSGAAEISDMTSHVLYNYHIVMGRSSSLTPEERKARNVDCSWGKPPVSTYDRLITMAKRVDESEVRKQEQGN